MDLGNRAVRVVYTFLRFDHSFTHGQNRISRRPVEQGKEKDGHVSGGFKASQIDVDPGEGKDSFKN